MISPTPQVGPFIPPLLESKWIPPLTPSPGLNLSFLTSLGGLTRSTQPLSLEPRLSRPQGYVSVPSLLFCSFPHCACLHDGPGALWGSRV